MPNQERTNLPAAASAATDALPSWSDCTAKKAVIAYVERVIREGSIDFVPIPERIAVFDNDGTLWPEAPIPFQFIRTIGNVLKFLQNKSRNYKFSIDYPGITNIGNSAVNNYAGIQN